MRRPVWSWSVVLVLLMAVLAGVLVVAALRGPGNPSGSPGPRGSAFNNPPTVSEGTSPKPGDVRAVDVEPPFVLVDAKNAYRATSGSCLGGATLERTTNGGAKWEPVDTPASLILQVDAFSSVVVNVVGADDTCAAAVWKSSSAGREWTPPAPTAGLWFRLPDTTRKLQTATGVVPNPCKDVTEPIVELDALSTTEAAVLCSTGEVIRTSDSGTTWSAVGKVDGAVALSWETPEMGWLLAQNTDTCPGFQVVHSLDGGVTWSPVGCVGDAESASDKATRPALSFADPLVGMASLDGAVFVTSDGGTTWQSP